MGSWEETDEESIAELEYELSDFTRTATWMRVMRPSLERRQREISRSLCLNTKMSLEDIREKQVIYAFIDKMLEEPIKFFSRRDGQR